MRFANLALLTAYLMVLGCSFRAKPKEIEFVLPDGFTGAFIVVEDPDGVVLADQDGVCRIQAPSSRILRVNSDWPLREMRVWRAKYATGAALPDSNTAPDTAIALRGGGFRGTNNRRPRLEFFVGSEQDFQNADSQFERLQVD